MFLSSVSNYPQEYRMAPYNDGPRQPAPRARILVLGFGHDIASWAAQLYDLQQEGKSQGVTPIAADLYLVADYGPYFLRAIGADDAYTPYMIDLSNEDLQDYEEEELQDDDRRYIERSLAQYETIEIVAHGLGVRVAAYLLNLMPEEWFETKQIRGIALAGTVNTLPDYDYASERSWDGLTRFTWESMLSRFRASTVEHYYQELCCDNSWHVCYPDAPLSGDKKRAALLEDIDWQHFTEKLLYGFALDFAFKGPAAEDPLDEMCDLDDEDEFADMEPPAGYSAHRDQNRALMELSAELRYLPLLPLGKHGRELFLRYFKLIYAYGGDRLYPESMIKDDFDNEFEAGTSVLKIRPDSPHLNCQHICELLLTESPDWSEVAAMVPQGAPSFLLDPDDDFEED